jgi:hypothetical protein
MLRNRQQQSPDTTTGLSSAAAGIRSFNITINRTYIRPSKQQALLLLLLLLVVGRSLIIMLSIRP